METKKEMRLTFAVSMIGGFFGGYAIFNRCDIFGSAQTANLIKMITTLFSGDLSSLIFLFASFVTYISAMVLCVIIKNFSKADLRIISLLFSTLAVIVIGAVPNISNHYVALLPIFFVTPIQWNAYRECGGYSCSTIFSTNNLREAVMSASQYAIDKDKKSLEKAKFFGSILLWYHIGVAFACVCSVFCSVSSIWFCLVPIAVSVTVYFSLIDFSFKKLLHNI